MVDRESYREELVDLQERLACLQPRLFRSRHSFILVLEGEKGTGRHGITDRLIKRLDRRTVQIHSRPEPSPRERAYHPLWRYWMQLPPRGQIGIFEHSWHSELLWERLEGRRPLARWHRSCAEAREFERWLADDGAVLVKIPLQLATAETDAAGAWNASARDFPRAAEGDDAAPCEAREAVLDLMIRTHTEQSPWQVIPVHCKRGARLQVLRSILRALHGLGLG